MTTFREETAMSDLANGHMRNHNEYTWRLPTPPRINVPPPTLATDMPGLVIGGGSGEEVDMGFLKDMDLEGIVQRNTLMDWAYERRRQAQMILPWLYLGPMVAAKDKAFLQREGITMVLAIRAQANSMMGAVQAAGEVCMEVATVEAASFDRLTPQFGETARIINLHIARVRQRALEQTGQPALGKVLIFCESGNEKSAAVAAAYLMETLSNIDHVQAMQVCQAQRFCVNFDDTLKNMLRSYWDILGARRSVATSAAQIPQHNGANTPTTTKSKRRIELTRDDGDMDMDDGVYESDALRFAGRDIAPFLDRRV
ncbi:FMI2 protein [Clathrospora elynae]|uniref:FMI2 protein n=1 Tax=Clathrospora elynae TaxID=706981 RepID=A0A6A5SM71_9PLEO|nr:FMI2 protein [Clathrospora elynae]